MRHPIPHIWRALALAAALAMPGLAVPQPVFSVIQASAVTGAPAPYLAAAPFLRAASGDPLIAAASGHRGRRIGTDGGRPLAQGVARTAALALSSLGMLSVIALHRLAPTAHGGTAL